MEQRSEVRASRRTAADTAARPGPQLSTAWQLTGAGAYAYMHIYSVYMHVFRHVQTWERAESDQSPEHPPAPKRFASDIF